MNTRVQGLVLFALVVLATAAPAQDRLKAGDVVWAQWKPNAWFHGKIAKIDGKKYHIAFDDGDRAVVDAAGIARDRVPTKEAVTVLKVRVLAKYKKGRFFPGKVTAVTGKRFAIQFDDGDKDTVDLEELRLIGK